MLSGTSGLNLLAFVEIRLDNMHLENHVSDLNQVRFSDVVKIIAACLHLHSHDGLTPRARVKVGGLPKIIAISKAPIPTLSSCTGAQSQRLGCDLQTGRKANLAGMRFEFYFFSCTSDSGCTTH